MQNMTIKSASILIVVLAVIVVVTGYAIEFTRVDSSLDRGGAFDYSTMQRVNGLSSAHAFPFIPCQVRNLKFLVVIGSSSVLLVLGFLVVARTTEGNTNA